MFDIGWSELLLIGVVALIVVGPKDLPRMFRLLGQYTGRARSMAREFQRALESAADESGVKDMAKDLRSTIRGEDMGLDEFRDFTKGPKGWVKDKLAKNMGVDDLQDLTGEMDTKAGASTLSPKADTTAKPVALTKPAAAKPAAAKPAADKPAAAKPADTKIPAAPKPAAAEKPAKKPAAPKKGGSSA